MAITHRTVQLNSKLQQCDALLGGRRRRSTKSEERRAFFDAYSVVGSLLHCMMLLQCGAAAGYYPNFSLKTITNLRRPEVVVLHCTNSRPAKNFHPLSKKVHLRIGKEQKQVGRTFFLFLCVYYVKSKPFSGAFFVFPTLQWRQQCLFYYRPPIYL